MSYQDGRLPPIKRDPWEREPPTGTRRLPPVFEWTVTLGKHQKTVQAASYRVLEGSLSLHDDRGEVVCVFAAGAWASLERGEPVKNDKNRVADY